MVKTIGAQGYVGIAIEDTPNTYAPPTKFFPIRSESLSWTQSTNFRRVIRGTADVIGATPGNGSVEGDIDTELLSDVLPYFLLCARGTLTTGDGGYEFVPAHNAVPPNTMSITVVRGEEAFGYVGCVVSSFTFGTDNDLATSTFTILGTAEQSVAVPAAPAYGEDVPFGSGMWNIQVPTETQIFDADGFSFEVNDNGTVQNRLKSSLGAQFISYGERDVNISLDRDFEDRAQYDAFKALTAQSITVRVEESATNAVEVEMPVAYIDGYDVGLSGVGDLVRASMTYVGTHAAETGGAYRIGITTNEVVPVA